MPAPWAFSIGTGCKGGCLEELQRSSQEICSKSGPTAGASLQLKGKPGKKLFVKLNENKIVTGYEILCSLNRGFT